ncbi:MAG TPA: hypothetical protein VH597_15020 [Verrucomicrobiae bacterium]|nr:hypothetical protein [Verrucomicrobiae bacterium]
MKILLSFLFSASTLLASAQTNSVVSANRSGASNAPSENVRIEIKQNTAYAQEVEKVRLECIQNRRRICGKIVKVLPEGLVVDSGYTNLMREPLNRSWLIPGTAEATKPTHLIEESRTGAFCVGLVFLTNIPRAPGTKPKLYDYVNIEAFPVGPHTYVSVGDLHRTVRGFSFGLVKSIEWKLAENQKVPKDTSKAK